jgi:signal transduction histidine kinase
LAWGELARELHDSVTQLIFSTTLIAQSISPA